MRAPEHAAGMAGAADGDQDLRASGRLQRSIAGLVQASVGAAELAGTACCTV
jgi:hypothetical protein